MLEKQILDFLFMLSESLDPPEIPKSFIYQIDFISCKGEFHSDWVRRKMHYVLIDPDDYKRRMRFDFRYETGPRPSYNLSGASQFAHLFNQKHRDFFTLALNEDVSLYHLANILPEFRLV